MRIAFIAQPTDAMTPPVRGGSLSLWIYYMAKACVRRGHQAVIFGNHGDRFRPRKTRQEGVDYVFTPTIPDKLHNRAGRMGLIPNGARALPEFAASWHHKRFAAQAARHAREMDCAVVHIMNYSQFVPVVRQAHPAARIALHMQCEWLTQLDREQMQTRLAQTDVMIGCSEYITKLVAERFPEHAARCKTVPNAADLVEHPRGPAEGSQEVLFVGRLSPEKGLHDLIRAFHLVLRRFPEARLRLVGGAGAMPLELLVGLSSDPRVAALRQFYRPLTGSKDPYLEVLEKEAGAELGRRILFAGRIGHDQIEQAYANAAVLVNPSLSESFGISLVEAMMRKLPVVGTRIGGMSYTIDHGVTGYLTEAAQPEQLAGAICDVLADPQQARAMGEAGYRKAVDQFSWERTADSLIEALEGR